MSELLENPYVLAGAGILFVGLVVAAVSRGSAAAPATDNGSGASVASLQLADNVNAQLAGLSTQVQISGIQRDTAIALANSQSQQAEAVSLISGLFSFANNSDNNATTRITTEAQINGGIAQTAMNNSLSAYLTPVLSAAEVKIQHSHDNAAIQQAAIASSTAKNASNNGLLGSIVGSSCGGGGTAGLVGGLLGSGGRGAPTQSQHAAPGVGGNTAAPGVGGNSLWAEFLSLFGGGGAAASAPPASAPATAGASGSGAASLASLATALL